MLKNKNISAIPMAILAAILFGISAPLAKALLGSIEPTPLASLLYFGCGSGVFIFKIIKTRFGKEKGSESGITKNDLPWLAGVVLTGGVAAPIILMFSLKATPAATASLLLNFEVIATALIAALFFKEALGKRIWIAVAVMTAAAIILTWNGAGEWGVSLGAIGILCACLLWGADNNMTRMISLKDPLTITMIKGFAAGTVSLIISLLTKASFPAVDAMLLAIALGAFCYGISIVLFILSMRQLGAARTSAFFGTAPFIGALVSLIIFGEVPAIQFFIAVPIMIIGAVLIIGEDHRHKHIHDAVEHDHKHRHDDNHHSHSHEDGFTGEHAHVHVHQTLEHAHPHMPDIHHRHMHRDM